jgi:hypothetical protein
MALPQQERPVPAARISREQCGTAGELISRFFTMADPFKSKLRLVMQRLVRAMHRGSIVDSSIDLGISLEALYLEGISQAELSFRLKIRAARFLGDTPAERQRISEIVGDAYQIRSLAVHTGVVTPKRYHGRTVEEVLQEGFSVAAKTVRRFIASGEPDWDALMFT